ncbi:hypothetical protein JXA32_07690 [Candidatus Sumerlaeota bacterium]|nr:hypothetical protein [Candidatus Sumerlaeota bacterium]
MYRKYLLATVFVFIPILAPSIPSEISISAMIESKDSGTTLPLNGSFEWEIAFHDEQTTTSQIGEKIQGEAEITDGIFSITLTPPEEIQDLDHVYYRLAVDNDLNGISESDYFNDFFELTSVPFAHSTKPSCLFSPHLPALVGETPDWSSETRLPVSPFWTPAGGVRFNKIYAYVGSLPEYGAATISFGVYNEEGDIIAHSGLVNIPDGFQGLVEANVSGFLRPNSMCYTAYGANKPIAMLPTSGNLTAYRNGYADIEVTGGNIPDSFDPETVDQTITMPLAITLSYENSIHPASDISTPKYRLIPTVK